MRPRHRAAENLEACEKREAIMCASMRPRHRAAENDAGTGIGSGAGSGFNEAAA